MWGANVNKNKEETKLSESSKEMKYFRDKENEFVEKKCNWKEALMKPRECWDQKKKKSKRNKYLNTTGNVESNGFVDEIYVEIIHTSAGGKWNSEKFFEIKKIFNFLLT